MHPVKRVASTIRLTWPREPKSSIVENWIDQPPSAAMVGSYGQCTSTSPSRTTLKEQASSPSTNSWTSHGLSVVGRQSSTRLSPARGPWLVR